MIDCNDKDGNCTICHEMLFYRVDVDPVHQDFGKAIPCPNPKHKRQRVDRLAHLDARSPEDRNISLEDIKEYHQEKGRIRPGVDTPNGSNKEALETARLFLAHPRGWFYVWGPWGNAKTDMLLALLNELDKKHDMPGLYVSLGELASFVRSAYAEKDAYSSSNWRIRQTATMGSEARVNHFIHLPVLAIDEFELDQDKVNDTPWLRQLISDILLPRHKQALAGKASITLFASNSPPNKLPGHLNSRLMHGINIIVENTAPDMRPLLGWE
jgi:DNA replication protein DnaC